MHSGESRVHCLQYTVSCAVIEIFKHRVELINQFERTTRIFLAYALNIAGEILSQRYFLIYLYVYVFYVVGS